MLVVLFVIFDFRVKLKRVSNVEIDEGEKPVEVGKTVTQDN